MNREDPDRLRPGTCPVAIEPVSYAPPRRNDPFPLLAIIWIAISEIDEAPRRIRRAVKAQQVKLTRSMARFGNRIPILVRQKNGKGRHGVIDGHARLAAARMLGAEKIACIVVDDLPDAEIRRLGSKPNQHIDLVSII